MGNAWGISFGLSWASSWGSAAAAQPAAGNGVVLFPVETLEFGSRLDKTLYALAVIARDVRPVDRSFQSPRDHLVPVGARWRDVSMLPARLS